MIFYYLAEGELIEAERVAVDEDGKVLGREQRALTARAGEFPLFGTHWLMDYGLGAALFPQCLPSGLRRAPVERVARLSAAR